MSATPIKLDALPTDNTNTNHNNDNGKSIKLLPSLSLHALPTRKQYELWFRTGLEVCTLCMAVAAMMSAAVAFADTVQPAQIASFGHTQFMLVKGLLIFFPFVYVPWLFFVFNNANSIAAYHEFFEQGIIIDFKQSANPAFVLNHNVSFVFLISFVFYISFAGALFLHFSSPLNVITLFFKQFVFECILFYLALLTVDRELITLREFIERYNRPDCERSNSSEQQKHRPDHEAHITQDALVRAGHHLATDYQIVSADVAFSSAIQVNRQRHKKKKAQTNNESNKPQQEEQEEILQEQKFGKIEFFLYGQYAMMVLGLIAVGCYQYQADRRDDIRDRWGLGVTPCVQVCVNQYDQQSLSAPAPATMSANIDQALATRLLSKILPNNSSSTMSGGLRLQDVVTCQKCVCSCLTALQAATTTTSIFSSSSSQDENVNGCQSYLNVGLCSSTKEALDFVCNDVNGYCLL